MAVFDRQTVADKSLQDASEKLSHAQLQTSARDCGWDDGDSCTLATVLWLRQLLHTVGLIKGTLSPSRALLSLQGGCGYVQQPLRKTQKGFNMAGAKGPLLNPASKAPSPVPPPRPAPGSSANLSQAQYSLWELLTELGEDMSLRPSLATNNDLQHISG